MDFAYTDPIYTSADDEVKIRDDLLSSNEAVCPECKKRFIMSYPTWWAYRHIIKGRKVNYCSYKCMMKAERKIEMALIVKRLRKQNAKKQK